MKLVSTNRGDKKTTTWKVRTYSTGIFKAPVASIVLGLKDVEHDIVVDRRYHGGIDKACYAFSADDYTYWKSLYPKLEWDWGMFGENLTINGLNEDEIYIGDRYQLGGAIIEVSQPRQPCVKLNLRFTSDRMIKQFIAHGRSGVYFRVLKTGLVAPGDELKLIHRDPESLSVHTIFQLIFGNGSSSDLEKALLLPKLAESARIDLKNVKLQ